MVSGGQPAAEEPRVREFALPLVVRLVCRAGRKQDRVTKRRVFFLVTQESGLVVLGNGLALNRPELPVLLFCRRSDRVVFRFHVHKLTEPLGICKTFFTRFHKRPVNIGQNDAFFFGRKPARPAKFPPDDPEIGFGIMPSVRTFKNICDLSKIQAHNI